MSVLADDLPILYVKDGCPYCRDAMRFLDEHGVGYRKKEVTQDDDARDELNRKSKQQKTPTLDWHGDILADFDVEQLPAFLRDKNVKLEDS